MTLDVDRPYIGSVTATTHQEKGIITLKAGLLIIRNFNCQKYVGETEIVRINSNNPRSPLETNYR